MMSRCHLTTIYADSSRPNTPNHANIFSACGGYLISISKTFPVNFHLPSPIFHQDTNSRPHASTQHTTKARPWYQAARAARRPVEMQQHVPEPPCYYRPSPSAVCRQPAVPDATPRSPEASNAQRQRQRRERRSQQANNQKISPLHRTTCTPLHPKDGRFDPTSPTSIDSS